MACVSVFHPTKKGDISHVSSFESIITSSIIPFLLFISPAFFLPLPFALFFTSFTLLFPWASFTLDVDVYSVDLGVCGLQ